MPVREALPLRLWKAIEYKPQPWAGPRLHLRDEHIRTLTTARQIGKSYAGAAHLAEMLEKPADSHGAPWVGVIAPTYPKTRFIIDRWLDWQQRAFGRASVRHNMNEHWAVIEATGAKVTWVSGDDVAGVVGFTFSDTIEDECQDIPDLVHGKWTPTKAVRHASTVSFGTPDITPDQTWFKEQYLKGQDDGYPDFWSANVTVYESPLWTPDEIALQKAQMTDREYRMLMLGQWVDEEGSVFQGFENALLPSVIEMKPKPGVQYVIGLDLAVYDDFTVCFVVEKATRTVVHMERWNQTDPLLTYDKIETLSNVWNHAIIVGDETGMGIPMMADLRGRGLRAIGQKIHAANKMALIRGLQAALEHRRIMIQPWPALLRELKAFVYHATPSGQLTASAAGGFHDDCIWALIMAELGCRSGSGGAGQNWLENRPARSLRERAIFV